MTEKDLMEGLNHIEDSLIEEAAAPVRHRRFLRLPAAAAAVLVLGAGIYAAAFGLFPPHKNMSSGDQVLMKESSAGEEADMAAYEADQADDDVDLIPEAAMQEAAAGEAAVPEAEEWEEAAFQEAEAQEEAAEPDAGDMKEAAAPETEAAALTGKIAQQSAAKTLEKDGGPVRAGIAGRKELGEDYHAAADYGEIYDLLKAERDAREEQFTDSIAAPEDLAVTGTVSTTGTEAAAEDLAVMGTAPAAAAAKEAGTGAEVSTVTYAGNEEAAGYSVTNVMTEGVDESDIIRTDGKYIYRVSRGGVSMTDIRDGKPGETITLDIPEEAAMDTVEELYVDGSSLVVLGWRLPQQESFSTWDDVLQDEEADIWTEPSYTQTIAAVFDLTEEGSPVYTGFASQDGSYYTSRKVGDMLYLFTRCGITLPVLEKKDALTEEALNNWIPKVNGIPVAADCIYLTEKAESGILVSSLRIPSPRETVDAKFLFTWWAETYVGSKAMYLYYEKYLEGTEFTRILKLPYEDGLISAGAAAAVPGGIRDRFAIQEADGCLRVLTTDWGVEDARNRLILLDENLKETGRIEDIAHGEVVYAARYIGDLAYFVTYRNTDPLFAADLSDPSNPVLLGELEISGFSEYLHPWDKTHLLGIGYETDPETGDFRGVKLTMFDISDPVNILAESVRVLEGDQGSSAIDWNYKAILVSPEKNLFGFMTWRQTGTDMLPCYNVFSWDGKDGFIEKLRNIRKGYDELYEECRGLYAGNTFYVADEAHIYAFNMGDGGKAWDLIPQ